MFAPIMLRVTFMCSLICHHLLAASVDTVSIFSSAMQKHVKAVIVLPEQYHRDSAQCPVIYLLHGLSDNYSKWIREVPELKPLSDKYKVMIVCPDGGYGSWYVNSHVQKHSQYESFVSNELIAFVDKNYRTNSSKEGRAITGLSMGGHGAIYNSIMHPQLYAAAGSMSGVVDLLVALRDTPTMNWINGEITKVLGPYNSNQNQWEKNSVTNLLSQLKTAKLPMIFDIGVDDFLIESNRSLHLKLIAANVKHEYLERAGSHNWDYWREAIGAQFYFLTRYLKPVN